MRIRLLCLCVFYVATLSGCMLMNYNLVEGTRSFQVQDYRRAFILLKPEAEKGNADAQYAIGYMYYYGQGVVENRQKAWYWINCAARGGQVDAMNALQVLDCGSHCTK